MTRATQTKVLVFVVVLTVVGLALLLQPPKAEAALITFTATLDGLQEVPPNASPATGFGVFTFNDVTKELSYNITFSGLLAPETASHIHGPAAPGVNAAVLFPLPVGSPKVGIPGGPLTPVLTAVQEGWLFDGLLYVNIHSTPYPGGEIRGQIVQSVTAAEPSILALLGIGLGSVGGWKGLRRRMRLIST